MRSPTTEGRLVGDPGVLGFEVPLWRSIAVFRIVALGYAAALMWFNHTKYRHPMGGWAVLGVMVTWTAFAVWAYGDPERHAAPARLWRLLAADLTVAALCLASSAWVEAPARLNAGDANVTASWVAAPVLAWAVAGGKRSGLIAAALMEIPDYAVRHWYAGKISGQTIDGSVLLLMAGLVVGHIAKLAEVAEARLKRAIELEASTRERERLARGLHDSVLQVLTLVKRRGSELGGEAAELGRLAGDQEAALRALISGAGPYATPEPGADGHIDLRPLLTGYESATVTVSAPATPVRVPGRTAAELKAAVGAALDNVRGHCGEGTRAWVLIEDGGLSGERTVTVSVRDEGPGIPDGRLAQAAKDGRLGIAQSIQGRIHDLGGTVTITSAPTQGTEIEMTVPVTTVPAL